MSGCSLLDCLSRLPSCAILLIVTLLDCLFFSDALFTNGFFCQTTDTRTSMATVTTGAGAGLLVHNWATGAFTDADAARAIAHARRHCAHDARIHGRNRNWLRYDVPCFPSLSLARPLIDRTSKEHGGCVLSLANMLFAFSRVFTLIPTDGLTGGRQTRAGAASLAEASRQAQLQEPEDVRRVVHEVSGECTRRWCHDASHDSLLPSTVGLSWRPSCRTRR